MRFLTLVCTFIFLIGCDQTESQTSAAASYLYVSAGVCYSGNNTAFTNLTSSNVIYRLDASTGAFIDVIADYMAAPSNPGDSPAGIFNIDSTSMYVAVENTTTTSLRRIERIEKSPSGQRQTFNNNTTALSAVLRDLFMLPNGDLLISRSTAVEYINSASARVGTPFISASAAPCNTSTTLVPKVLTLSNGKIVFLHAAAAQNRFGIFATAGGTTCASAQAAPNVNAFPTNAAYDALNNKLLVSYSGNAVTTDLNSIYVYTINETTNAISSPQKIYDASLYPATYSYLLYGISAMTFDASNTYLYVATAISSTTTIVNYAIEKFLYDPTQIGVDNAKVLTRVGSVPFYAHGFDTKCISGLVVAN